MRRVVVTGMGLISPLGNDPSSLFDRLLAGDSGIRRLPESFNARLASRVVAPAVFTGEQRFPAARLRMLDRVSQFALCACAEAIADAQLALGEEDASEIGVAIGTGMGGAQSTDDGYQRVYEQHSDRIAPFSVLLAMTNAAASWIGIEHRLRGPNLTYSTACSSSAVAIGEAARRIAHGEVRVMIAGGTEAPLTFGTLKAWEALKTLAQEDAANPAASCKPFARDRTGLVLGEGAAILVLEDAEHARLRGARIHAEVAGYGLATDTEHITRPSVGGQAKAMALALAAAGLTPSDVGYINAHGTGTQANDAVETAAIKEVFGTAAGGCPISSTKSMHGHLLGAAGALEFIISILALQRGIVPPTAHLRLRDPDCDLDYVSEGARHIKAPIAVMSNSFAFGGTNAVLIARRA
jgi:beta-ketoacyl-acyl-carrier-protein synthase II